MANHEEQVNPSKKGDCYESSYKNACELAQIKAAVEAGADDPTLKRLYSGLGLKDEIVIVHGWVTSPEGPYAGRRMHHAWIEAGDGVIETQCGLREGCPDWQYYKKFAVHPTERYSVSEAEALVRETGWAKAWRGKGEDRTPNQAERQMSKYFQKDLMWLGTRSRKKKAESDGPPPLEDITKAIKVWAPCYSAEIEKVWIFGSRAGGQPKRPDSAWDVAVRSKGATPDEKDRVAFAWLDYWANELEILCKWRVDVQVENPPRTTKVSDGVRTDGILVYSNAD